MRSDPACSGMVRVGHFDACVEYPERTGARRTNYMREEARWGETVAFEAGMEYERQPKGFDGLASIWLTPITDQDDDPPCPRHQRLVAAIAPGRLESDPVCRSPRGRRNRSAMHPSRSCSRLLRTGALLLIAGSLSAQAPPLSLVSTAWSPFTNEPGRPRFALDLVETALGRFGVDANTTIVSPAVFTPSILEGPYDGSAAAWRDPERERVLMFSEPYLENRLVLVGRRGADVSATRLADLDRARVALVEGYSYGEAVSTAGPVFIRSASEEDSLTQLLEGQVEYTLMDELVVAYILSHYPAESAARLQIGATALITRELHFVVRRSRPDAGSIITRFNEQLRSMIVDGTYHQVLHLDWIQADVNADGVAELIPRSDRAGPAPPSRPYLLFSTPEQKPTPGIGKPGFYVGGTIYSDWASVPSRYKAIYSTDPDPRRSTASIFQFKW
jgi:polar amino acid transport system substrate-binding protein